MNYETIFTKEKLLAFFPADRADAFFDALYGGAEEGAYDISLAFVAATDNGVELAFELKQRQGKCLACNLTYGLPQVFTRHPIINLKQVVAAVAAETGKEVREYKLGATKEHSRELHTIPLMISFS